MSFIVSTLLMIVSQNYFLIVGRTVILLILILKCKKIGKNVYVNVEQPILGATNTYFYLIPKQY